jgi:hypothetical protein
MSLTEEDKELIKALCQEKAEGKTDLTYREIGIKFELKPHEVLEIWTGMKWDTSQRHIYYG